MLGTRDKLADNRIKLQHTTAQLEALLKERERLIESVSVSPEDCLTNTYPDPQRTAKLVRLVSPSNPEEEKARKELRELKRRVQAAEEELRDFKSMNDEELAKTGFLPVDRRTEWEKACGLAARSDVNSAPRLIVGKEREKLEGLMAKRRELISGLEKARNALTTAKESMNGSPSSNELRGNSQEVPALKQNGEGYLHIGERLKAAAKTLRYDGMRLIAEEHARGFR